MKQMYLLFLQQASQVSFLQRGVEQPVIRPGQSSCMSQFIARLQVRRLARNTPSQFATMPKPSWKAAVTSTRISAASKLLLTDSVTNVFWLAAQSTGSPRLKALLERVNLPYSFLTWELVNQCIINGKESECSKLPLYFTSLQGRKWVQCTERIHWWKVFDNYTTEAVSACTQNGSRHSIRTFVVTAGKTLVLSVSDAAVPLEFELREPPDPRTQKILNSFPKTPRQMRSAFGYTVRDRLVSFQPTGLFAGIWRSIVTRTNVSWRCGFELLVSKPSTKRGDPTA